MSGVERHHRKQVRIDPVLLVYCVEVIGESNYKV
jgi:hypothetical protein